MDLCPVSLQTAVLYSITQSTQGTFIDLAVLDLHCCAGE